MFWIAVTQDLADTVNFFVSRQKQLTIVEFENLNESLTCIVHISVVSITTLN